MSSQKERNLEIFDLDHTLFKVNSSFRFGLYLYRSRVVSLSKLLFLMGCYFSHKLGCMKMSSLNQIAARSFFLGQSLSFLDKSVTDFLDKEFEGMLYMPAVNRLRKAQSKGSYTIILSSSPDFIVRKVAAKFEVDEWAATQYTVKDDRIDGIAKTIEGQDKADFVISKITHFGTTKEKTTGYTDSHLDTPFLEAVGNPVAVNPDKILKKICRKRGWQTIE